MSNGKESKFTAWIERNILPIANKIQRQVYLQAIQSAFLSCMPLMIVGSFALILTRPLADYTTMLSTAFGYSFFKVWKELNDAYGAPVNMLRTATISSIAVYVSISISYFLARHYKLNTIITSILTLAMFFVLCSKRMEGGAFNNDYFGGEGLFAAILIGIGVTELYRFFVERKIGIIQMPDSVPPVLKTSFESLFPIIYVSTISTIISIIFSSVFQIPFPQAILNCMKPFVAVFDNVFGLAFSNIISQIVWWFGIHNTAVTSLLEPLMMSNYTSNAAAFAAGTAASNLPHIWTEPLWWNFTTIGGSGATLAVAFLLLRSKSKQMKTVGKLAIIPGLFNINEPILFGLPIVLNPLFLLPFICAQTFNAVASYLCMAANLVNKTYIYPGWNIPAPFGQFLATMDIRAVFLTIALIIFDGLIYYPFLKVYEKQKLAEERVAEE